MKHVRRIAIAAAMFVAGAFLWDAWSHDPVRSVERISGLDLPANVRLIHHEEEWSAFLGDGVWLWVFELPPEFEAQIMQDCRALGYKLGPIQQTGLLQFRGMEFVNLTTVSCYSFQDEAGSTELIAISSGNLLVFVVQI